MEISNGLIGLLIIVLGMGAFFGMVMLGGYIARGRLRARWDRIDYLNEFASTDAEIVELIELKATTPRKENLDA